MNIAKKYALKKIRMHSDDTYDKHGNTVKTYASKGTIYYQISNGTIGAGSRYKNYSEKAMAELMASVAWSWGKAGYKELETSKSNVLEFPKKEEVAEYNIDSDRLFTYDDIPF